MSPRECHPQPFLDLARGRRTRDSVLDCGAAVQDCFARHSWAQFPSLAHHLKLCLCFHRADVAFDIRHQHHELWAADEFLDNLAPESHAELIRGRPFDRPPSPIRHAKLLNFVDHLLRSYLEHKKLGQLFREVVAVKLSSRNVFLPDLAYFTNEQVEQLEEVYAPIAPTLVVEALSPRTADRDTGPKFAAYEEHGVQEYWILSPDAPIHRFFRREGELLVEFAAGEDRVPAQTIPGFWLKRSWLDPDNLPEVKACLEEMLVAG